jgi:hypothetical protein
MGSWMLLLLSYGLFYFENKRIKHKVYTCPQENIYLQSTDASITEYCLDNNKFQRILTVFSLCLSMLRSLSR